MSSESDTGQVYEQLVPSIVLQSSMLIQGAVLETEVAIVVSGADRRDDGEVFETGVRGDLLSSPDESTPEANMLRSSNPALPRFEHVTVDVNLTDHRAGLDLGNVDRCLG